MWSRWTAAVFGLAAALGCAASGKPFQHEAGAGGAFEGVGGGVGVGFGGQGGVSDACMIYVVGTKAELFEFSPSTLSLDPIGVLDCPAGPPMLGVGPASPFSMAVDRGGTAWVLYTDANIYLVNIKDASCKKSSYAPTTLTLFGMAFVAD